VHMGVLQSKLAEHIASVRGNQAEAHNKNHGANVEGSALDDLLSPKRKAREKRAFVTYGARPTVAATDGRDKMPKPTVIAAMTITGVVCISLTRRLYKRCVWPH
jgi:hypothetical protein